VWTVIKDSLGQDLSKITVPVYFNEPTSITQNCAITLEYNHLLDLASLEADPMRRLALFAVH